MALDFYARSSSRRSSVTKASPPRFLNRFPPTLEKLNISVLYLLTNTAQDYFAKRGFTPMARDQAPAPIQQTSQYATEPRCSTATLMFLRLEDG